MNIRLKPSRNQLLALLPDHEIEDIIVSLELTELPRGLVLADAGQKIDYVYFPFSGIGSVVTISEQGQRAEAGMFGCEGFSPTSAGVGGAISVHQVVMQVAGEGLRIPILETKQAVASHPVFSSVLARFIQTFATQVSFTALCNANLQVDRRLARWLLMCHDRIEGDEIVLTHDFIAGMLAVRRPSVTTALHMLEGERLVRAERGRITVRDRSGLELYAGGAYGKPEEEYRRLLGSF
jgi:CRP-like cAMP-binding protein